MSPLQGLFFVELDGAVAKLLVKYIARYFKRANSGSAPESCTCLAHVLPMSCTCLAQLGLAERRATMSCTKCWHLCKTLCKTFMCTTWTFPRTLMNEGPRKCSCRAHCHAQIRIMSCTLHEPRMSRANMGNYVNPGNSRGIWISFEQTFALV